MANHQVSYHPKAKGYCCQTCGAAVAFAPYDTTEEWDRRSNEFLVKHSNVKVPTNPDDRVTGEFLHNILSGVYIYATSPLMKNVAFKHQAGGKLVFTHVHTGELFEVEKMEHWFVFFVGKASMDEQFVSKLINHQILIPTAFKS